MRTYVKKALAGSAALLMMLSISSPISAHQTTDTQKISHHQFVALKQRMSYIYEGGSISKHSAKSIRPIIDHSAPKFSGEQDYDLDDNYGLSDYHYYHAISKHAMKTIISRATRYRHQQAEKRLAEVSNQGSDELNAIRNEVIHDINNARIKNHLRPLKPIGYLQECANYRAPLVLSSYETLPSQYRLDYSSGNGINLDNYVHGESSSTSGYNYLMEHGHNVNGWSANAINWSQGYSKLNVNADGTPLLYDNNTPEGIADNIVNIYLDHDMVGGENNGHRNNILNPKHRYIGVGIKYDPVLNLGSENEQYLD